MRKKFFHTVTKSIILTILPLIYGICFPYALSVDLLDIKAMIMYIASIIAFIVHLVILIIYGIEEHKQKNQLNEYVLREQRNPTEFKCTQELINSVNKIVLDNANYLYEAINKKVGHCEIVNWHFMEARGDEICKVIYNMVKAVAERGEDFAVSIMFKKVRNGIDGYTMLSRTSNDLAHTPRSYRSFISEKEAEGFYYKKLFDEKPTRPSILINKRAIEKNFKDSNVLNYSQYIALPISCKSNKIIGLLQIVSYNDSIISENERELERLCNNYFSLCTTLMLLTDKSENVIQTIGAEKDGLY